MGSHSHLQWVKMTTVLRAGRLEAQNAHSQAWRGWRGAWHGAWGFRGGFAVFTSIQKQSSALWKFVFVSSQIHSSLWSIYYVFF